MFDISQATFIKRRKEFFDSVSTQYPLEQSMIVLFSGMEFGHGIFRQESSFYYLTGIVEPGVVVTLEHTGKQTLWIPHASIARKLWAESQIEVDEKTCKKFGFDEIRYLGDVSHGYSIGPVVTEEEYTHFIAYIKGALGQKSSLFTLGSAGSSAYYQQRLILQQLLLWTAQQAENVVDVSSVVHAMRRKKDVGEIQLIYKAIEITNLAHEAALAAIRSGVAECEIQAAIEYIMIGSYASPAFPSIVASGKNGAILHYTSNNALIKDGDMVVVDIGAQYNYYAADITRTYPASGVMNERQKELYQIVLDTHQLVADSAKPGMWLSNDQNQDMSLHHIAKNYLTKAGYGEYFPHGIGHFLGIDVHDVGDRSVPLEEGDCITIEPGIYIKDEGVGIRIEDDYWIIKGGAVCMSEELPKSIESIERYMQYDRVDQEDVSLEQGEEYH